MSTGSKDVAQPGVNQMPSSKDALTPVYLPSNEPYLGRDSLFRFDQAIQVCLEANADVAAYTRRAGLTDLQIAACQIIPQGINLALTIRELVRQGYLFGALVLLRSLVERAGTISYLHRHPRGLETWKRGWSDRERPKLHEPLASMLGPADTTDVRKVARLLHHLTHGDPIGAQWNVIRLQDGGLGYAVGKVIDDPDLCDFICTQGSLYLIVLQAMASVPFPNAPRQPSRMAMT